MPSPFPSRSTYSLVFHLRSSDFMLLPLQAKAHQKQATTAKMDMQNRAICYAMRNPPKGHPRMSFPICKRSFAKQMVVDALLSLLVRTQEYNFVVRSGVFVFPIAVGLLRATSGLSFRMSGLVSGLNETLPQVPHLRLVPCVKLRRIFMWRSNRGVGQRGARKQPRQRTRP